MVLFKANDDKTNKIVTGFLISNDQIEDKSNLYKNKCPSCQKIFEEDIIFEDLDASYVKMTCPYCQKSYESKSNCFLITKGIVYNIKVKTLSLSLDNGLTWHSNLDNLNDMLKLLKK